MDRTFESIPDGKLDEADQQSMLVSLGWSKGITWNELLLSRRVLIVSEAGAGKTFECRRQAKKLWDAGEPAFFIELAGSEDLRMQLDDEQEERLENWLSSQSDVATFFLDSIDELRLTQRSFEMALKRFKKVIGSERLHRVRVVVTTRPIELDKQVLHRVLPVPPESNEEAFAMIAMGQVQRPAPEDDDAVPDWRTVALMPLSDEQIAELANNQGVNDADAFLTDIRKRNAQEFARRPQDLIELCADWPGHERIRTHLDQVKANVRVKLQPRTDRPEPAELSVDKAMEGSSRLALAMLVTRRMTIRHSAASDDLSDEAALDPVRILSDWKSDERKALLERPLFGFASYGRVRFHHRSVMEFLAAKRLRKHLEDGKPISFLKRLLFTETRDKTIVRPSKRPIAGWLALCEDRIFELLRDNEPDVLLDEGDPESLSLRQRCQALRAYVTRHGQGGWRGLRVPHIQIHRFASPELAGEINELWKTDIQNTEVRQILLNLIVSGPMTGCADIAHDVARDVNASPTERLGAVNALIAIRDSRIEDIASELAANCPRWSDEIARGILIQMFPKDLTIDQACQILGWVTEEKFSANSLSWNLPRLIADADLEPMDLKALRDGLSHLLAAGLRWVKDRQCLDCDRSHLRNALAAVCIQGLGHSRSEDWLKASVLAVFLNCHDRNSSEKVRNILRDRLTNLNADENSRLFWVADSVMQKFRPFADQLNRLIEVIQCDGPVKLTAERDLEWVIETLGDASRAPADRELLLEAAMKLPPDPDRREAHVSGLKPLVADQPDLTAKIENFLKPSKHHKKHKYWVKQAEKQKEKQRQEEAKAKSDWKSLWREVANHPEKAFSPERGFSTAWDLWQVMRESGDFSQESGWNWRFIEENFGKESADRLRCKLMAIWRNNHPDLPSERSEDGLNQQTAGCRLGFAAIYAEAEGSSWATELTEEEAKLAARYAFIDTNGIPYWMEHVVDVHPDAVDEILVIKLDWELSNSSANVGGSMFLQHIFYAPTSVARRCVPRLLDWLKQNDETAADKVEIAGIARRLRQITRILLRHGGDDEQKRLRKIAQRKLRLKPPEELAYVWLPTLMQIDPELGVSEFEKLIREVEPAAESQAVSWFSVLFGDHPGRINLEAEAFSPQLLLRLVCLAYQHMQLDDDAVHQGTYTPDMRDSAQYARNAIVTALFNAKGEEGWAAKLEMADDPLCEHFKDRILAVAEEHWAKEIDSDVFNTEQAVSLDKTGEAPPSTNGAMFALMKCRLADLDELLSSDASPREAWAGIRQEKIMRREIARALCNSAHGLYGVDQERVTADEKETDIRLCSTASEHEAVIELKIAEKWSANELRSAVFDQLVKKYMAPENRRSGCLLITVAKDRKWKLPDNETKIGPSELKSLLCHEAKRVEEKVGGGVKLSVHLLDLRPRLEPKL
ncbi:MAG: hypothetical protein OXC26_25390 [Albidovulum sp.]|nr:hypothetical protein [Albidovulum sp.]